MSEIELDIEAVETARAAMLGVRDTVGAQCTQHNQAVTAIEGMLSSAATAVFDALNPLHGLDPFGIWDRWGFGGVAQACTSTHGTIDGSRGTASQIVTQLCDAHRGQLAPVLFDRAVGLQSSLGNALESLWTITSLLSPGNIMYLLENPGAILEHFSNAQGALSRAHTLTQDYCDFLNRLEAQERQLIQEIIALLSELAPGRTAPLPLNPVAPHAPTPTPTAPSPSPYGPAIDDAASHLDAVLDPTGGSYSMLDLRKLEQDPFLRAHEQEIIATLTRMEGNHPIYDSNHKLIGYGNVQCVAFVEIALMLAGVPMDKYKQYLLGANGDAQNWYPNLQGKLGWAPHPNTGLGPQNGEWLPKPGDIVVWRTVDPQGHIVEGHIAVVSGVSGGLVHFYQANAPGPTGQVKIVNGSMEKVTYTSYDGVRLTMQVEGFLSYDGS